MPLDVEHNQLSLTAILHVSIFLISPSIKFEIFDFLKKAQYYIYDLLQNYLNKLLYILFQKIFT
jgi:hypothetical protein